MTSLEVRRAANGAVAVLAHLPLPPVPAKVARHMSELAAYAASRATWQAANPDQREDLWVGHPPRIPALISTERADAERAASVLAVELAPVAFDAFRAWLGVVNAAVRNPQPQADFGVRCLGLFATLDDLPTGCFTADARRDLPAFFPSAADIRAAVEPGANTMRRMSATLDAALAPMPASPPQPAAPGPAARTQAEIDAVRAQVSAFVATTRHAPEPRATASRSKAILLSDGALLAQLEHSANGGNRVSAFRAEHLRRKMGAAT